MSINRLSLEPLDAHHSVVGQLFDHTCRRIVMSKLNSMTGSLSINDQWGTNTVGINKGTIDVPTVVVRNTAFYRRLVYGGALGAARSWTDGDWYCQDLCTLFRYFLFNLEALDRLESGFSRLGGHVARKFHLTRANSPDRARQNIHDHYDLGNKFFSCFLDDTMTYSSAIFKNADMSLQEASIFKLDRICRKLNLKDHDRVLEIGCGWGSFALRAASAYGCHVTAVTVSTEQYEYVKSQVDELGLAGRVHVLFSDYRDLQGNFDKIVSIEMIEAVGHENLPEFFEICRRLIKPEGQVALQAITMPDQRYKQYLDSCDFIQRYIFPGSCVPSLGALIEASAANTDLRICHVENIGLHYAETLKRWKSAFSENVDRIRALGYGESFLRLWWYYLNYCEAGFSTGYLGDFQIVMAGPSCRKTVVVEGLPPL